MARIPLPLDAISVASPCPVAWDDMNGDGRVRFCSKCEQRVYNLSEMTRKQAEALVRQAEGRLCVRYYRRPDGTVMTKDCPVGLAAFRRRVAVIVGSVAAGLLFLVTGATALVFARGKEGPPRGQGFDPISRIRNLIDPPSEHIMGDICPAPREPGDGPVLPPEPPPPAPKS